MNPDTIYTESELDQIIFTEHMLHPTSSLRDYYKLLFQSTFGQGHFVISAEAALDYLNCELQAVNKGYIPLLQDISAGKGLYRASLDLINNGFLTKDAFMEIFLQAPSLKIAWQDWEHSWNQLQVKLLKRFPELRDDTELEFCSYLLTNKTQTSHSEEFRLTYHPHYRVMQLNQNTVISYPALKEFL